MSDTIIKGKLKNGICNLCDVRLFLTPGQIKFWHKACRKKGRMWMVYPKGRGIPDYQPTSDVTPIQLSRHSQLTPWYVRLWRWLTFYSYRMRLTASNLEHGPSIS